MNENFDSNRRNPLAALVDRSESMNLFEFSERFNERLAEIVSEDRPEIRVSVAFVMSKTTYPFYYKPQPKDFIEPSIVCAVGPTNVEYVSRGHGYRSKYLPLVGVENIQSRQGRLIGYRFDATDDVPNTLVVPEKIKPIIVINHTLLSSTTG